MNSCTLIKTLIITFTLFSTAITVCGNSFILVNKSKYNISCRDRSIQQAKNTLDTNLHDNNILLKPGEGAKLSLHKSYSIRTAGAKTGISQYYDVPPPYEIAKKTLSKEEEMYFSSLMFEPGFTPIISVSSGLLYGWKFSIAHTWANKTDQHPDKQTKKWNKEWTDIEN